MQAGITFAVGGIDISVNQARRSRRSSKSPDWRPEPRIQLHLWAICLESNVRAAEAEIRRTFGRSTTVHRPVLIGRFDGDRRGYAYALKTSFIRRIAIAQQSRPVVDNNGSVSWHAVERQRNTRTKGLTRAQFAEVAQVLELLRFDRRLFLIGAEVVANSNREPVIRPG